MKGLAQKLSRGCRAARGKGVSGWRAEGWREGGREGARGRESGNDRCYKRDVSDKLRDCRAYVGALCAIAIRERAPYLFFEDFQRAVNARGNIADRIIPRALPRALPHCVYIRHLLKTSRGTRGDLD